MASWTVLTVTLFCVLFEDRTVDAYELTIEHLPTHLKWTDKIGLGNMYIIVFLNAVLMP